MPTYEYECSKGHHFEVEQRITEDPLKRCRVCRSKVRRLISPAPFILKGGGWYSDGYGSAKSGGSSTNGASESGAAKSSTSTSSSDSKSSSGSSSGTSAGSSSSSD